jgi:DNA-binding SARP family transcriptional activator
VLEAALEGIRALAESARVSDTLLQQLFSQLERERVILRELEGILLGLLADPAGGEAPAMTAGDGAQLRIHCLGQFRVWMGRQNIPVHSSGKCLVILKYLALNSHKPVPKEVLLETLWPDAEPGVANNRLKVAVHRLRQMLGSACPQQRDSVLFQNGAYGFNPAVGVWTDVDAFEECYRAGLLLERAGQTAEAMSLYTRARQLYRGDLLPDDTFEEWTLVRREELRESYLDILGRLSRHYLRNGQTDAAIEGWRSILAKDPWREDAYRALMICHARIGRRSLALRWYDLCVIVLREQLNLEPEEATVDLCRRIREGHEDWTNVVI